MNTNTMMTAAVEAMERELIWIVAEHEVTSDALVDDIRRAMQNLYRWGRTAAQCEAIASQIEEAMAASR